MYRNFYFLSIILVFVSCAKKIMPNDGYHQINQKKAVTLVESNKSIATLLTANENYKNELTLNDSVFKYNDSLKSNYQKFNFKVRPNKKYRIKISSLCDCGGFKKYMFIPQIITDNLKNRIITESDSTYFNYEHGPLTLNKVWHIKDDVIKEKAEFEFLLVSDNSRLSEKIYKFIINPMGIVPVNVKSTLTGKFVIKIEEY